MIILSTDRNIEYLGETSEFFLIKLSRLLLLCLLSYIQFVGFFYDSVQPLVYVLLSGRSETVYVRMIEQIKNIVEGFNPADIICISK